MATEKCVDGAELFQLGPARQVNHRRVTGTRRQQRPHRPDITGVALGWRTPFSIAMDGTHRHGRTR
jgi:hypothetical protein